MSATGSGRFAPSPSGDLHIGNIRTGLLAYARARQTGRRFLWRIEDLDRVRAGAAQSQLEVFAELGVVGGVLVLALVGFLLWTGFLAWRDAGGRRRELYAVLLAAMLAFAETWIRA